MRFGRLLSLKLFVIIFFIMSALSIVLSLYHLSFETKHYEEIARTCAGRVSTIVTGSMRMAMMYNDRESINDIIKSIVVREGIDKICMVNMDGVVAHSSADEDVGLVEAMDSNLCSPCHQPNGLPRDSSKHQFHMILYNEETGTRDLHYVRPIENESSCSAAPCHYHKPDEKFLGVLRVVIPLQPLDVILSDHQTMLIGTNISLVILMGLIVGIFIWFAVHIPVTKLILGTREISSGNLNHKIDINSKDEIGSLAFSFNEMTHDLKEAKKEITEWSNQLEERVREKTNELESTQKRNLQIEKMASLGQLSATVAHELNNPIAGILTYSKLIQKKLKKAGDAIPDSEEVNKYLHMIETESARSGDIVKNLLLFSREGSIDKKPHNINRIIDESIELINHHLELHNISLNKDYQKDLPLVNIDQNQIKQALIALSVNAVEAMEDDGTLTIKTDRLANENAVNICIKDNGRGIPEEIKPNIFEPFFTTKNAVKGVGLGLSSVFAIIERHEGKITVESEVDVGTTFIIKLPLKSDQGG